MAASNPPRAPIIVPMKRLIAIVEDEPAIRDNYAAAFTREGYIVRTYGNRTLAMAAFAARLPDLAVIDISLEEEPEGGFELCRQLRALSAELPIIFLTARDSELDAVSGLRLGADDFLTKDLSLAHLIARVNALFRRVEALRKPPDEQEQKLHRGPLTLDVERMRAEWNGKVVLLSSSTTLAASMSCCRFFTCPGWRASACTIQNSVSDSGTT